MRRSFTSELVVLAVGLVGIRTMEHWIPYWIAFWQFAATLAIKMFGVLL